MGSWDDPSAELATATLDRDTGKLAAETTAVDQRYTEYFLAGTEPVDP